MTGVLSDTEFTFDGRVVSLPVEIRRARQWATTWLVPAGPAQAMIDYSGLEVVQPIPGRAVFALAFVDYLDGDLDTYHEVAFSFLVRPHDASGTASTFDHLRAFRTGDLAAFIYDLPVDQEFTRAAGTTIWGYPKWIAEITFTQLNGATACSVYVEGDHQFTLSVKDAGWFPFPSEMPPTYSWRDGTLRRTAWEMEATGGSARPGGARLDIGATGPLTRTLRRLQLPRRPLMSTVAPQLHTVFSGPEVVEVVP